MATFRSVLETATGMYRETHSGQTYQREDLLGHLSAQSLDATVHIRKVGPGEYYIELETQENGGYQLYSRRRSTRAEPVEK